MEKCKYPTRKLWAIFGNYPSGYSAGTFDGNAITNSTTRSHFLSVMLSPRNGTASASDPTNGIMKIDDNPSKATGVGIQLSTSESASGLVNLTNSITQNLSKDGSSTITIPLFARYIQTENSITAGIANGKLEYTITYQ